MTLAWRFAAAIASRCTSFAIAAGLAGCGAIAEVPAAADVAHCTGDAIDTYADPLSQAPALPDGCRYTEDAYTQSPDGWPAGTCFHGAAPAADAYVAPMPEGPSCEAVAPTFFPPGAVPPETLQPELGHTDPLTGKFEPWQDGDWVPIVHGAQGKMHVAAQFRVHLAGEQACDAVLQTTLVGYVDCVQNALGGRPLSHVRPEAPEMYVGPKNGGEILAVLSLLVDKSWDYCGRVLDLRLQVRIPGTPTWGEARRRLRMYDLPRRDGQCEPNPP